MYKFIILLVVVGGYLFAGAGSYAVDSNNKSKFNENKYCWAEDTSSDDYKLEAGRRRGKGNRGDRRRGGGGLR